MVQTQAVKPVFEVGEGSFGDLNDPELQHLPSGVANLTASGASAALQQLRGTPQGSAALVNQLRTNPKAVVVHVFNLTPAQRAALWEMPDAELGAQLDPLADALEAGNVAGITLELGTPTFHVPSREFAPALSPIRPGPPIVVSACKWNLEIHFVIENQ